jgi:hypothetical protein
MLTQISEIRTTKQAGNDATKAQDHNKSNHTVIMNTSADHDLSFCGLTASAQARQRFAHSFIMHIVFGTFDGFMP